MIDIGAQGFGKGAGGREAFDLRAIEIGDQRDIASLRQHLRALLDTRRDIGDGGKHQHRAASHPHWPRQPTGERGAAVAIVDPLQTRHYTHSGRKSGTER